MPMSSNMSHADIDQQRFGVSCQDGHERLVLVNGEQQVGKDLTFLNDALELLAQASLKRYLEPSCLSPQTPCHLEQPREDLQVTTLEAHAFHDRIDIALRKSMALPARNWHSLRGRRR